MKLSRLPALAAPLAVVVGLALPAAARAQGNVGTIDGRVLDSSKAAVPGATVTAKNVATGLTRTAVVSPTGTYRVTALPAGTYDVSASLAGFSTQVTKGVEVRVGDTVTVDFAMKVGAVAETVEVVGESPLVQATTSDVGQVITQKMVENIPLNGRKFQDLSLLVPGTRPSNYYDPTKTEVGGISFGGATGRSVIINVDGGDDNDGVVRGLLQQFSNDAIQEYKVTTQRYSAEYGRSVGGVVNVITKSGTNDFHGSAFVYARNQSLNAKTYFEEKTNEAKPDFSQQQFGATLGGPIARDKAHFFASYEGNRRNQTDTIFTNGVLPDEEGPIVKPFRNHLLTAKLNFELSPSNSIMVRYGLEDNSRKNDFTGGNLLASGAATNTNTIHSAIMKDTAVIGPSKVNELSVMFQHFENDILADHPEIPGITTPDFTAGASVNTPQQTIQRRWQIRDDFSFRKEGWAGDHNFKAGAEMLLSHFGGYFIPTLYGYFIFHNPIPGAHSVADYENSIADTFTGSAGTNVADDNWTYVAGYIQDDWKPTPKLTLNLGLRYEIQYGPYANKFQSVGKAALAAVGYNGQMKNDLNNFGPRVGFAYDVKGDASVVVRGGWGRYYDEIFQNITLYEAWSDPSTPLNFVSASPSPWTPAYFAQNRDAIRNSFLDPTFAGQSVRLTAPNLVQPYADHANAGFSVAPNRYVAFDIDYVYSRGQDEVHRWRINTPQNVNTLISPAGVFAPEYGPFLVEGNRGHSTFNGVYFAGKVRTGKFYGMGTYTWSKAMNLANDFNSQPADITNANWELDWGPTPNDIRHRVTAAVVYQLPLDFQLSSGFQYNTGKPYNALAGLGGLRNAVRAIDPATGQMFTRDSFTGPDFLTWDLRVSKMFRFGGAKNLEVLFEVFNLTNHVNFAGDPAYGFINTYTSPNFGTATQIVPNSQRQAEFGVRFAF
ncbi:MAG TPA: carboxypeptidase regulatory-like domain-containing protein [Vicinamibacteria bacterium]|nr:carboxypeptidase regulatory-like domain-containing protein [Vicinamibacteria bacterium]